VTSKCPSALVACSRGGLPVIFQEVVHSMETREADCAEQSVSEEPPNGHPQECRLTLPRREDLVQFVARGMTWKLAAASA
jgi:hypothetical protein